MIKIGMKKVSKVIICLLLMTVICGCKQTNNIEDNRTLPYRIVDKEEAIKLYLSNDDYFNSLSEYDIQYRTQSIYGKIDHLKEYGAKQMSDFSDIEKKTLNEAMDELEKIISDNNYHLPEINEITFIKSSQEEEGGSVAYTHGTQIYMNNIIPLYLRTNKQNHQKGLCILAHEIFHCLTRNNPDFKKEMYSLINFNLQEDDFKIPSNIKIISISNPDVERHNAYATFSINNKKKDCYVMNISTKPFQKKGDSYTSYYENILVPINKEASDKDYYLYNECSDVLDVFGENTKYITDPEECMADNFSYALVYGLDGQMKYNNPNIIEGILKILK